MRSRKRKKAADKECCPKPAAKTNIINYKPKYHNRPFRSRPDLKPLKNQIGNLLLTLAGADLAEAQRLSGWLLFAHKLRLYYSEAGK